MSDLVQLPLFDYKALDQTTREQFAATRGF